MASKWFRILTKGSVAERGSALQLQEHVEQKHALQNLGIAGSIATSARFALDEHRTDVRSCIATALRTSKSLAVVSH